MTPGLLYGLVVCLAGLAGSATLIGLGYLLGRRVAMRQAVQALAPLTRTVEALRTLQEVSR